MRWAVALAAVVLVGACQSSPSPDAAAGVPATMPTPTPTERVPLGTPVPAPTPVPGSSRSPAPADAQGRPGVVVSLAWAVDVEQPAAATVVMDDGLVVWNEQGLRRLQLASGGLEWVRSQLDATGLLDRSGAWEAQLRVGAHPAGHGVTTYTFELPGAGEPVRVATSDPGGFDRESWIVPPEMQVLGDLAAGMVDADTWIPSRFVAEGPAAYEPSEYLFHVTFYQHEDPGRSAMDIDVDDVAWPLTGELDAMGDPVPGAETGQIVRCAVVPAALATAIRSAASAAGADLPVSAVSSTVQLRWKGGDGLAAVTLQQLLPSRHDCAAFVD